MSTLSNSNKSRLADTADDATTKLQNHRRRWAVKVKNKGNFKIPWVTYFICLSFCVECLLSYHTCIIVKHIDSFCNQNTFHIPGHLWFVDMATYMPKIGQNNSVFIQGRVKTIWFCYTDNSLSCSIICNSDLHI